MRLIKFLLGAAFLGLIAMFAAAVGAGLEKPVTIESRAKYPYFGCTSQENVHKLLHLSRGGGHHRGHDNVHARRLGKWVRSHPPW